MILLNLWAMPLSFSGPNQDLSASRAGSSFEADLLRIDGDRYVVKDTAGVERAIHVGTDTEIYGQVKVGDRIQLWVEKNEHARTIMIVRSGPR